MELFALIAGLPLEIESYELEPLEQAVSSDFTRRTTVVRLRGAGEEGVGEDVTYDGEEHGLLQQAGPVHDLSGSRTVDSFSELIGSLDLFPARAPKYPEWRLYRRWAFESAALDLALRQAGRSLADALGRRPAPVRFVVSLRLAEPPSLAPVERRLELYPGTRFKLDPTSSWSPTLVAELAELDCVDTVDLKGAYRGTVVDQPADARLYGLVAEGFPEAWIEDPDLTDPGTAKALEPYHDRITWDAPIHSVDDIEGLPFPPSALNVKPSRFGSLRRLLEAYHYCKERGIGCYGGGQFELGPGRGQIQYLASLFHPDAPNDVAPGGYNEPQPRPGLPTSPLKLERSPPQAGFR
jgi:L-alanine-DL-glutamate epimerase-like enolase superfamily enzyme